MHRVPPCQPSGRQDLNLRPLDPQSSSHHPCRSAFALLGPDQARLVRASLLWLPTRGPSSWPGGAGVRPASLPIDSMKGAERGYSTAGDGSTITLIWVALPRRRDR